MPLISIQTEARWGGAETLAGDIIVQEGNGSRISTMPTTEANIWEMILRPHFGRMTAETAKAILALSIPDAERARTKTLLAKAKAGTLAREESHDLEESERAGNILSILKAKARRILP
jgi:hypothetical protein